VATELYSSINFPIISVILLQYAVSFLRFSVQLQIVAFLIPLLDDKFPLIRSITCWTLSRYSKFIVQVTELLYVLFATSSSWKNSFPSKAL
jgi:hypothetical protein